MKDQYGNKVPNDLVVLDVDILDLTDAELETVVEADWYEVNGRVILASFKAIKGLTETDPRDAGIDLAKDEIFKIDNPLKRWNEVDGFYHA